MPSGSHLASRIPIKQVLRWLWTCIHHPLFHHLLVSSTLWSFPRFFLGEPIRQVNISINFYFLFSHVSNCFLQHFATFLFEIRVRYSATNYFLGSSFIHVFWEILELFMSHALSKLNMFSARRLYSMDSNRGYNVMEIPFHRSLILLLNNYKELTFDCNFNRGYFST